MPVCHQSKLLFIHIPKNAGKFIEDKYNLSDFPGKDKNHRQRSFLGLCARALCKFDRASQASSRSVLRGMIDIAVVGGHLSLSEMQHLGLICGNLNEYHILVSSRHPYTRMLSLYCHLTPQSKWSQIDFEDFCETWPVITHYERHGLLSFRKCQSQFVIDINGHVPDGLHIARVENLEKDLLAFESKTGCKAVNYFPNSVYQGPSRVVSDIDKNRKPAISKKAKISIASHYSSDFDLFGYNP